MVRNRSAAGSGEPAGRAGRPPARRRGPVPERSLGLLQDVKGTVGRDHGGSAHQQSQAAGFDSCLSQPRRTPRRRLPSVARIEINRQVLAENLSPEKVRALQLAPVELIEGTGTLIIDG